MIITFIFVCLTIPFYIKSYCCSVIVSDFLQPDGLQHSRLPCPSLSPRVCSDSCPLSWWCYLNISSSATHFSFFFNVSQHQGLFQWVGYSYQAAKVLELQFQHQSVCAQSLQSLLILWDPMYCSLQGSSFHRIFLERILEWVAMSSSRESSWPRDWTHVSYVSCTVGRFFYHWATRETLSISTFKECSELISFRADWFSHLAVQGTLKSLF